MKHLYSTVFMICNRYKAANFFLPRIICVCFSFLVYSFSAKILKQMAQVLGQVTKKSVRLLPDLLQYVLVRDHCSKCFVFLKANHGTLVLKGFVLPKLYPF